MKTNGYFSGNIWLNERDLDIRCVRIKPYTDTSLANTVLANMGIMEFIEQSKENKNHV